MPEPENYWDSAESDAADTVEEFIDEIVEMLISDGEASKDLLNDYGRGDSYHHERHVDKDYSLLEAANLLDQLDRFEETDEGLWEGRSPREAVAAQAAYTYGNAVYSMFQDLIGDVNDRARDVLDEFENRKGELKDRIGELEKQRDEEEDGARRKELEGEVEKLENRLERLEEGPDPRTKRELERAVYVAIGRKQPRPLGPKEWSP